ncbi:MAG: sodium:calcium antiporter [Alphaproteobacteria bacterium]|nr:sodium:calcium antiporter [Alphaproteobacteria bacterium]
MDLIAQMPLPASVLLFCVAAAAVWWAGGRLSIDVAGFADRVGMSQGFAGMLLLGGITSLPEIATAGSAALTGSPDLAVSNLLGTASINVLLLVVADLLVAGAALTALSRSSSPILQGVLGMVLMTGVAGLAILGDQEMFGLGVGYGTTGLMIGCAGALWLASRYERAPGWTVADDDGSGREETEDEGPGRRIGALVAGIVLSATVILVAGFVLSQTGDGIATASGIETGMVGLVLVGLATSLPELSSIRTALRIKRFDLAIGDVMGTNLFNIAILFVVDLAYRKGPALGEAGRFEALAALLAVAVMGLFLAGLLARRRDALLRLGPASWAILATYAAGLFVLSRIGAG